jgi:hypothetical protein
LHRGDNTLVAVERKGAPAGGGWDELERDLGHDEAHRFGVRWRAVAPTARPLLHALYPHHDPVELEARVGAVLATSARRRRRSLRDLDASREIDPTWFQNADQIGYVAYADRFGGTFDGVAAHLDHLSDLHVTYLHLMNVLKAREGENDGGYAIVDYTDVETRLGTRGSSPARRRAAPPRHRLCIDLVLNHTASEHPWALAAKQGSAATPRLLPAVPRSHPARPVRTVLARGVPRDGAGQLHVGRRPRRLGVDHVQHVSVGPRTTRTPTCSSRCSA